MRPDESTTGRTALHRPYITVYEDETGGGQAGQAYTNKWNDVKQIKPIICMAM